MSSMFQPDAASSNPPAQPSHDPSLDAALVQAYLDAKGVETAAIAARREAQTALATRIGVDPEGGATRADVAGIACSTRANITRAISPAGAIALKAIVPSALFDRLIQFKPVVVARELTYIKNNEVELYGVLAEHITVTPGAVSVEIK